MPRIEFTINEDGSIEEEAFGFKGNDCDKMLERIINKIGAKVKSKRKKTSWHQLQVVEGGNI